MTNTLETLAERCEAAQGPDRELDECIMFATQNLIVDNPAGYTASLDAAMTLVPDGWHVSHFGESLFMTRGPFAATLETWGVEQADDGSDIHTTPNRCHGVAATPALALCAAALRARAQKKDEPDADS